jgi:hypothetical protein
MTMEAVRGAECYGFDKEYPVKALWHNTILPFTRNVTGSMDYTPVTFSNQQYPHLTTFAHELALSVVFESGVIHFADRCEPYLATPEFVRNFLKTVPAAWDNSVLLAGYPGKFCIVARKSANAWYIGGINGTGEELTVDIDLSILPDAGLNLTVIQDGKTNNEFETEEITFQNSGMRTVKIKPYGGFVATLK